MVPLSGNRRLVIAHNPHSSRAADVQEHVFDRLDAAGYDYDTIEVRQAHLNDNVARLAPEIKAGDLILSAAGDGSAHAVFHSVVAAGKPGVELGFLAFGNFNDLPHVFNSKDSLTDPIEFLQNAKPETVWPLKVSVNDEPLRNALLYASVGWTARAANQFDSPGIRHKITHGGAGLTRSFLRLGWYYFKTRRDSLLPAFRLNGKQYKKTDVICANGPEVARLFRSGKQFYRGDTFLFFMIDVRYVLGNIPFLASSLLGRMKGAEKSSIVLEFKEPSALPLQCDGEVVELQDVNRLTVSKAETPLTVLTTKV